MGSSIKQHLTESQWEAVSHVKGPLLVLAGAGSGKTRVITYRIAHMIRDHKIPSRKILAMTFTNKAANEMKRRVVNLVGDVAKHMTMGTFHSVCVRILRRDIDLIKLPSNFIIFDEDDQARLMRQILKDMALTTTDINPKALLSGISWRKNKMISVDECSRSLEPADIRLAPFYKKYEYALRKHRALDFDDLLLKTLELLRSYPEALLKYQDMWPYLLVDEYQDTNIVQSLILDAIAMKYKNICVVGDDDQSIYGWRGAEVKNILKFPERYLGTKIVKLEQNYRSTKNILEVAHTVIQENKSRMYKKLWTDNQRGDRVSLYNAIDERDEALMVCQTIEALQPNQFANYGDFCVLYRINSQSRIIEDILRRYGIPYRIVGGLKFYDRREIRDLLAYLRLINNHDDDVSLLRIINVPSRGIGKETIKKIMQVANRRQISLFEAVRKCIEDQIFPDRATEGLKKFYFSINEISANRSEYQPHVLLMEVIDKTKYFKYLDNAKDDKSQERIENAQELVSAIKEFEIDKKTWELGEFLDHVALISDVDTYKETDAAVTLMTLHAAKGLEFPMVFMVGMETGLLPHARSMDTREEIEEERRLCYVGITRAMKKLIMSYADSRTIFGKTKSFPSSIFLSGLDFRNIEMMQA